MTCPAVFRPRCSWSLCCPCRLSAGTKALQFSPPSREPFPLAFCPPAAVCCQGDGSCGTEGALRIQERLHKYSRAQELEKDITELRQLLGAVGMDEQALQEA